MTDAEKRMKELKPLQSSLESSGFIFSDNQAPGCSFLFPDGRYLNLRENRDRITEIEGDRGPVMAHHLLDRCMCRLRIVSEDDEHLISEYTDNLDKPCYKKALQRRIVEHTDNAIVLNDGTNFNWENSYIDLPVRDKPTTAQLNKLTLWIDNVIYGTQTKLDVGYGDKVISYNFEEENHPTTDDIIKDIKKIYQMI